MENYKYSKYSLKPVDTEDRKLFWRFRVDDILDLFQFVCIVETIWFLGYTASLINEVSKKHMGMVFLQTIVITMHWSIFCFRFRLGDRIVPVTIALYTIYQILIGLTCKWIYYVDPENDRTHIALASNSMIVYCIFMCVSIPQAIYFGAIFALNVMIDVFSHHDM